jgi:arylsulfatase A-like enzyme
MKHTFVPLTTILLLKLVTSGLAATTPNIVVILADDLGWKDLGCYGSESFQTPRLDRMAASGMRFTSAYAASCVCSPTRASMMTGKYPGRIDLTIWLGGRGGAPAADHLPLDEVTIAEALREAGYLTAMVGKWHLGDTPYWPKQQGFDIAIGEPHAGSPAGGYYLPNRIHLPGAKEGDYLTDRLTDEAVRIIEDNRDRPFFLYQAYHSVHTPIQGRPDLTKKHQARAEREEKQFNAQYAAMIESLDTGVGRIMDTLQKYDLLDRTVVFFTSDNGGFAYSRGKKNDVTDNSPLRFGKGYCYEGGHRVPWIVHYPPCVPRGRVCDEPVITTDLYPTILKLAGLEAMPQQHCDGVDLTPLLDDASAKLPRDALYWHYPHNSPQGGTPSGAIRMGDWKLIEFFGDNRRELYRLDRDLGEQHDLSQQEPEKLKELHDRLLDWRRVVDAKLPSDAPAPEAESSSKPRSSAGQVTPTIKLEGFASLTDVEVKKCEVGFELASNGNGVALKKLEKPITGKATIRVKIQPSEAMPSNGFLALGAEPTDAGTVKCGWLVGGGKLSAFTGSYPPAKASEVTSEITAGKTYELEVVVDIPGKEVILRGDDRQVVHRLPDDVASIQYLGYAAIRTRTRFSEIAVYYAK